VKKSRYNEKILITFFLPSFFWLNQFNYFLSHHPFNIPGTACRNIFWLKTKIKSYKIQQMLPFDTFHLFELLGSWQE